MSADECTQTRAKKYQSLEASKDDILATRPDHLLDSSDEARQDRNEPKERPHTSAGFERHHPRRFITANVITNATVNGAKDPASSDELHGTVPWIEIAQSARYTNDLCRSTPVVEITDGGFTFRFPTPTPTSPKLPPRSGTFHPTISPLQYDSPRIGIAIGSPSNAPPNWGRSCTAGGMSRRAQRPPSRAAPAPPERNDSTVDQSEQRKKTSNWKSLGCQATPEYGPTGASTVGSPRIRTLAPSEAPSPVLASPRPVTPAKIGHFRASSFGKGGARLETRERLDRTSFMPSLKARISRARGDTTPSPRANTSRASKNVHKNPPTEESQLDSTLSDLVMDSIHVPPTPRLDLDLAEIRPDFDRFSVMFAKQFASDLRPSLLERRQSRLQMQRSSEAISTSTSSGSLAILTCATSVQRSLTLPSLVRPLSIRTDENSSISSRVATPSTTAYCPRLIHRSQTAPSSVPPYLSAAFGQDQKATTNPLESSPETQHSAFNSQYSQPPTPSTITTNSDTESVKQASEQSEPAWDMVTSKAVKIVSSVQEERAEPYPRGQSPEDPERQLVQVSVARSVSVSRARSRVSRALSSKQPLKPRVVDLNKNRKSTIGVLVSPGDECEVEQMPEPVAPTMSKKARSSSRRRDTKSEGEEGANSVIPVLTREKG